MVPETFNNYNTNTVDVCKTCDFLATEFRSALLEGRYKYALRLYMTGNINLRCPLANVKSGEEVMYPVHCASMSGNLELMRWLIDTHRCPYEKVSIRRSSNQNMKSSSSLILTSHGRTILDIAVENGHIDVLKYLVQEKEVTMESGDNDGIAWRALQLVLNHPNADSSNGRKAIDRISTSRIGEDMSISTTATTPQSLASGTTTATTPQSLASGATTPQSMTSLSTYDTDYSDFDDENHSSMLLTEYSEYDDKDHASRSVMKRGILQNISLLNNYYQSAFTCNKDGGPKREANMMSSRGIISPSTSYCGLSFPFSSY